MGLQATLTESGMQTAAIVRDTFREALSRKIFWGLLGGSLLVVGFFLFLLSIDLVDGVHAAMSVFGREVSGGAPVDVNKFMLAVQGGVAAFLFGLGLWLAVFSSAGFIPALLEKGGAELVLSKPISRAHLLAARTLGVLLVIAVNLLVLVGGVWLVLGYKTRVWSGRFWVVAALALLAFAVLLTVEVLVGVALRSAALAILVTFFLLIASPLLAQQKMWERLLSSAESRAAVRWLYLLLPKIFDLGNISRLAAQGDPVTNWMPMWSSALFGAVMFTGAAALFSRQDY